jgi:hypothetical protein
VQRFHAAPQIRDLFFALVMDPGSAAHHFMLRGVRGTKAALTFFIQSACVAGK